MGIAQITTATYRNLQKRYLTAELPEDPQEGRNNHKHALRGAILHGDVVWWTFVKDKKHRDAILRDPDALHVVLAGGYNANIRRVDSALHKCKQNWLKSDCGVLPEENRWYIIKYRWIHSLLTDKEFRRKVEESASPKKASTSPVKAP